VGHIVFTTKNIFSTTKYVLKFGDLGGCKQPTLGGKFKNSWCL